VTRTAQPVVPEARRNAPAGVFLSSLVKAQAPQPQTDVQMMFRHAAQPMIGGVPMMNRLPQTPIGESIEDGERIVKNDPRESFFWSLPNKLTPQQCLQMLRAALAGDLFQQYNLSKLMADTWPVFRMSSHQLMEAASYMRYAVHPFAEEGKKPTQSAIDKADLVSRAMRAMNPSPFNDEKGFSSMAYALCDAMLNGISLVELVWSLQASTDHGREWLPSTAAWVHPRHYTFNTNGEISIYTDDTSRTSPMTPGYRPGTTLDPNKFLCGQYVSAAGSSLNAGLMRPLALAWAARQFNWEWMLNTAKQYGSPFIDITYKAGTVSTGVGGELEKLNEMLKTAGAQRRLIHPEGTTALIHPPTSLGKENPQRFIWDECDKMCLFLILGQTGTTLAVTGQLGNDDSHENVKEERKLGLANWLARNPFRQFARAVLRKNYQDDSECPNIEPDTTKPLKPEQVTTLVSGISGSRVPVRADELYKKIGFTQPDVGETVLVGGELMIQEEAQTKEDKFNEQLEQQTAMAETQMELQGEQQPPAKASERVDIKVIRAAGTSEGARKGWEHRTRGEALSALRDLRASGFKGRVSVEHDKRNGVFFLRKQEGELAPRKLSESITPYDAAIRRMKRFGTQDLHGALTDEIFSDKRARREWEADNEGVEGASWEDAASDMATNYLQMHKAHDSDTSLRSALITATDEELAALEASVTAAETAPHKNGEVKAVELGVEKLTNRIKF
jgi:phage gp29-like protein